MAELFRSITFTSCHQCNIKENTKNIIQTMARLQTMITTIQSTKEKCERKKSQEICNVERYYTSNGYKYCSQAENTFLNHDTVHIKEGEEERNGRSKKWGIVIFRD